MGIYINVYKYNFHLSLYTCRYIMKRSKSVLVWVYSVKQNFIHNSSRAKTL